MLADTFDNAFLFVGRCPNSVLLTKASLYITDHATVMLKVIIDDTTSSVDIGNMEFTYAIINKKNSSTKMGKGNCSDHKDIMAFYSLLSNAGNE